jgi:hypothetical protein
LQTPLIFFSPLLIRGLAENCRFAPIAYAQFLASVSAVDFSAGTLVIKNRNFHLGLAICKITNRFENVFR